MKFHGKAQLTGMRGDEVEGIGDFLGRSGVLHLVPAGDGDCWFDVPRYDMLSLERKRATQKGDKITVSTHLGNTFTFTVKAENNEVHC